MKLAFAILAKKEAIKPELEKFFLFTCHRSISFRHMPVTTETWISGDRHLFFIALSNENLEPHESLIINNPHLPGSVFTISGYLNSRKSSLLFNPVHLKQDIKKMGGVFSVIMLNEKTGQISGANNLTRIEPVYWANGPDFAVIGNWALTVHLLQFRTRLPEYDPGNLYTFINTGYYADDSTPYKGVQVLPPASSININRDSLLLDKTDLNQVFQGSDLDFNTFYNELSESFLNSFSPLKGYTDAVSIGLTGGKDSRLILAGLKALNFAVKARTTSRGDANYSDVEVAKRVADKAGIEHTVSDKFKTVKKQGKRYTTVDLFKRTCETIIATDGMLSNFENSSRAVKFNESWAIFGVGGELFRGGYAKSIKDLEHYSMERFLSHSRLKHAQFFHPDYKGKYQQYIEKWMADLPDLETAALLDAYYLSFRCGRWSSAASRGSTMARKIIYPFLDNRLVNQIYKLPVRKRLSDELIYNIMLRLAPELTDIPFANDFWVFETAEKRQVKIQNYPHFFQAAHKIVSGINTDWRREFAGQLWNEFYEQIFHSSSTGLIFEIIDRNKLEELFHSAAFCQPRYMNLAFNLYTSSVLLSNAWLTDTIPGRPIKVFLD